jgi:hypothetical protein
MEVKQDVKDEVPKLTKGPEVAPFRTITNFSQALRCMDSLMIEYGVFDVSMLVEDLKDSTGKVKAGAKDMLISAVSEMTRRSHAIRLIAFGSDSGNLVSFLASANETGAYSIVPQYDIRGSISQLDKSIAAKDASAGVRVGLGGGSGVGLGGSKTANASVMALDLAVIQTKDYSVIPGVVSKNQIVIFKEGEGTSAEASIGKFGVDFSMNLTRAEGDAQALRNLIELASVELIGKLTKTPYWNCMNVDPEQQDIQDEIYDWYYNLVADQQIVAYFQEHLANRNYYAGPIDGQYNGQLTEAVKLYQQGVGLEATGNIDRELFAALLNKPTPEFPTIAAPVAAPESTTTVANLDIHFDGSPKASLKRGEQFQVVIEPSQDAYVFCYFESEDGGIQRFFPNRFRQDALVKTADPLKLPGKMPFKLFASQRGNSERMACFSSPKPLIKNLPVSVKGTDFENLTVGSLEEVQAAFENTVGPDLGGDYFEIKVK